MPIGAHTYIPYTSHFHYYCRDHLGNNRVVVSEDGEIEQVTHYYPYGGLFGDVNTNPDYQPYKYGGKESNCTATQPVALVLVKERDGWFVDDFLDKDGNSEKAQMKEYLKTEQTQSRPDGHLNIVNPLPR